MRRGSYHPSHWCCASWTRFRIDPPATSSCRDTPTAASAQMSSPSGSPLFELSAALPSRASPFCSGACRTTPRRARQGQHRLRRPRQAVGQARQCCPRQCKAARRRHLWLGATLERIKGERSGANGPGQAAVLVLVPPRRWARSNPLTPLPTSCLRCTPAAAHLSASPGRARLQALTWACSPTLPTMHSACRPVTRSSAGCGRRLRHFCTRHRALPIIRRQCHWAGRCLCPCRCCVDAEFIALQVNSQGTRGILAPCPLYLGGVHSAAEAAGAVYDACAPLGGLRCTRYQFTIEHTAHCTLRLVLHNR